MPDFSEWEDFDLEEEYEKLREEKRACRGGDGCECDDIADEMSDICVELEDRGVW